MSEPSMGEHPTRPRYGVIHRHDGSEQWVVFIPSEMKDVYRTVDAGTEQPVTLNPGETIQVRGQMKVGQGILYRMSGTDAEKVGRVRPRGKEVVIVEEEKKKDSTMLKGLGTLFALGGFVLIMIAGIKFIIEM